MRLLREELAALVLALQFMTRLPISSTDLYTAERFARSRAHYPFVGLLIGGICAVVYWGASGFFEPTLAALLAVAAGIVSSGALHEDGLADVFDGIGGGRDREHALDIMKDSRLGTYGVLGLALVLAAKIFALSEVPATLVPWLFMAGHSLSRAAVLTIISTQPYARAEGTAKSASGAMSYASLGYAFAFAAAVVAGPPLVLGWPGGQLLVAAAVGGATVGLFAMWHCFHAKLRGYTGDCLGAAQQTCELGLYLAVAAHF